MRLRTKLLIGAGTGALIFSVLVVVAFANLTRIVRTVLAEEVPGLTFKELEVRWNKVSITEVVIKRRNRVVFKVDAVRIHPSLASVFSDRLYIASIDIDGPYVYLVRNADGSLQMPIPEGLDEEEPATARKPDPRKKKPEETKEEEKDAAARDLAILIDRIRIRDGKGDLVDHSVNGSPAKITLSGLNVTVKKVAMPAGDEPIDFDFSTRLEGKRVGTMEAKGWYDAKRRSADMDFAVKDAFLPTAEPYYRSKQTTASLNDGILDLDTDLTMENGRFVAKNRIAIDKIAFSRDGLFMGVPVSLFQKYLQDQGKPFQMEVELEGSLDDKKSKLQQQLVAAVVKALAQQVGKKALDQVADELQKGDLGKAVQNGAGGAVNNLFGR